MSSLVQRRQPFPNGPEPAAGAILSPALVQQLVWAFVILGLCARAVRYLLKFPLWEDECFLAVNYFDRDYLGLTKPLDYHQAAPLLFLWLELAVTRLLGFNEYVLRLVPFLSSVASLFLFARWTGKLVSGTARLLSVAVFAVSYPLVRYSAEAKPYGIDLFVSLVLLTLTVEWWQQPARRGWLWALVGAIPVAIGLSFPAAFVGGGISLWLAAVMWQRREGVSGWLAWFVFNCLMLSTFAGLFWLSTRHQSGAELQFMRDFWQNALAPYDSIGSFLFWLVETHCGALVSYPVGSNHFAGIGSTLLCATAIAFFWRSERRLLLLLCLAPLAVNLLASLLHRYPYGWHVKFTQYIAPAICLLVGVGGAQLLALNWLKKPSPRSSLGVAVSLLAVLGMVLMARDFSRPYKAENDRRIRDFARVVWPSWELGGEVVYVETDLGERWSSEADHELCLMAEYLCNQRIYSPRQRAGTPPAWDKISADRPLRCVHFSTDRYPDDQAARDAWLATMQSRFDLASHEEFPLPYYSQNDRDFLGMERIEVFRFVPRSTPSAAAQRVEAAPRR